MVLNPAAPKASSTNERNTVNISQITLVKSKSCPTNLVSALWRFMRPHTIIGTSLAVVVLYFLAWLDSGGVARWDVLGLTYIAAIMVNIYIVGLNQLTDIEIDAINKPYLPLASNEFTWGTGLFLVVASGITALGVAAYQGLYLLLTIGIVFLIGTAYSLPPLRLKRFPFWAAACITIARAIVGNSGVYLVYSTAFGGDPTLPSHILLFITVIVGFGLVISFMKDVPDIEGDKRHQISTMVIRLGAQRVMVLCRLILGGVYLGIIGVGVIGIDGLQSAALITSHGVALMVMWHKGARVNSQDKDAVYGYYMFIWRLFYLEFLFFFIAALLNQLG